MLNRIVLIGRLTKDPELRYTPNGAAVASFSLAVDRSRKNAQGERETDFINVVAWQKLGELCANYLSKGKLAAVEGELHIRSFDGQDGQKRWITEVVADNVRFLSPKDGAGSGSVSTSTSPLGNEISFTDDDIPF
ncbi:MAG: single-stranded DNA-binding protein [Peptococcaceae bacterium]|nr:single-stranded DNA-binding protein [Peptococcaceae bacterium]